jgi:hypothetical protein
LSEDQSSGKTKSSPPKKRRKLGRPRVERIDHVIEITNWHWDYMFGIDDTKYRTGPFNDFRHLVINGNLIRPSSIKASAVEVTCFPNVQLSERKSSDPPPKGVGWISHRGKDYNANLHMPMDVLGLVLQMMVAGRYRYVLIEAEKSFRGEAAIRHYRFSGTLTDDD